MYGCTLLAWLEFQRIFSSLPLVLLRAGLEVGSGVGLVLLQRAWLMY